jgi:CPA2 family monovalent cation:H+ antiporter-2
MHQLDLLRDLVILVALAIPVVAAAQRFRIPTVVGFLLTGLAIGPHALGFIRNSEEVAGLAELGVVLLLFTIGLELSLSRIIRLGRSVVQGGGVQLVGTAILGGLLAMAIGLAIERAVFFGMLIALSSTAIVLKLYADRRELDLPHGRVVVAILLFQDLCVVPLMLLTPLLGGADEGITAVLRATLVSLLVVGVLVAGGRFVVPWVLENVVGVQNREVFTLAIMFFGLGAAYVTAMFGLSLALGAFIAGLVVSESEYGLQALSDVMPFRDTFTGIFFISVGMLVDLPFIANNAAFVLLLTIGIVALKAFMGATATRTLGRSLQVSIVSGIGLAQVGEFSFILAVVGSSVGLLADDIYQVFLAISVVSMLATPFLIAGAAPIADRICRWTRQPALQLTTHEYQAVSVLRDHVIIVGYGLIGHNLARVLKAAEIPYVILEQNGQIVRRARINRQPIFFGDGTRRDVLEHVGIDRARALVFAISASADTRRGVAVARQLSSDVSIIVRTRLITEIEELLRLGANQVIPEEFETALEIFSRVLRLLGIPANVIEREVHAVRGEQYEMLRGLSLPDLRLDALRHLGVQVNVETVMVEDDAEAVDEDPVSLSLRRTTGATVIAVIRDRQTHHIPDPDFRFHAGDTVVLVGTADALGQAVRRFRGGQGNPPDGSAPARADVAAHPPV